MKKQEKGDLLEKLVLILQRSTTDNPTTKIYTKHKITDRDGIKRELDVYCECETNGILFRYAFECKNHQRGIEMKEIDAFAAKTDKLNITPFFVTTSYYQKSSKEKAAKLGITLFTLSTRLADKSDVYGLTYFEKIFELVNYFPQCKGYPENELAAALGTCEECQAAVNELVNRLVPALAPQLKSMLYASHEGFKDQSIIPELYGRKNAALFVMKGNSREPHVITHESEEIRIEGFFLYFNVWYQVFEDIPLDLQYFTYSTESQPDKATRLSYAEFLWKESRMFIALTQVTGTNVFTIGEVRKPEAGESAIFDDIAQSGKTSLGQFAFERMTTEYSTH